MSILRFDQITKKHKFVGGKAYHLANLSKQNFPVPKSIIITEDLEGDDFEKVCEWWESIGSPKLAARSSAEDEDGAEYSFAGQNSSFLNISSKVDLKDSILKCFDSVNKKASKSYREGFAQKQGELHMNVLVQEMVKPLFAGVYFSVDPRDQDNGDVIEYVEGLGEALVSGEVTPFQIIKGKEQERKHELWKSSYTEELRDLGVKVASYLEKDVDMEWAVDESSKLILLQARPVTAKFEVGQSNKEIQEELERLKSKYSKDTFWDGQTFAEWVGIPSFLSFSIFYAAFSKNFAYGDALKRLGYSSFEEEGGTGRKNQSVLNLVFGRAYINLNKLKPLFFGPIPYDLHSSPRPHLKFNWRLITFKTIFKTPSSIAKMLKVGWTLNSKRSQWLNDCNKELGKFRDKMIRPRSPDLYQDWTDEELLERFSRETYLFSKYYLLWPFILTVLIESTHKSLLAISRNVFGKGEAEKKIKNWMAVGLHTTTYEMKNYYEKACRDPKLQPFFMARYGHRGPGELDLKNPRWIEIGDKTFVSKEDVDERVKQRDKNVVAEEIEGLQTFKKTIILQEWKLLKEMLELRERWKMEILKPFSQIRFISEELAKRSGLGKDFYYLSKEEIIMRNVSNEKTADSLRDLIEDRKRKGKAFKLHSFPQIVSLGQIEKIINGEEDSAVHSMYGEPISPGLVFGTIKIVHDYNEVSIKDLPDDVILVAEATDPGWTPLFLKAKGLIIEKGGLLSHSAIVAREMGIPAVSSMRNCLNRFKDGERVCLNGNTGRVTYE